MRASVHLGATRVWRRFWIAAILFMFYALTLPFSFVSDPATVHQHWVEALNRSTFGQYSRLSRTDILQNVLLFIPIGCFGVASFWRARPVGALFIAVGSAAGVSATCELLQLFTVERVTSLWDVWANVTGAVIGGVLFLALQPIGLRVWNALPDAALERRRVYPLWSAAAVVVIAAAEPFDFTLDVGSVWTKVKTFMVNGPWIWVPISDELLTVLRFAMLSLLAGEWLRHKNTRSPGVTAFAASAMVGMTLEILQFIISSRLPSVQDFLAAASGALLGAGIAPWLVRRFSPAALLVAATVAAAIPFYLQPFSVSPHYSGLGTTPFLAYYQRTSLQTVSHVTALMLIYAPVGFAMMWSRVNRHIGQATLVVLAIAGPLEYAQGWIAGRFPDVTDLGIALLGGLAGAALARFELRRAERVHSPG